ncbi:hypothetical protein T484DRAFT_1881985, partial [Baffinella frigidus]
MPGEEFSAHSCTCHGFFKASLAGRHEEFVFVDGSVYSGEWVAGEPEGQGKMTWPASKAEYTGAFKAGTLEGQGEMRWADGTVYTGAFTNGKPGGGAGRMACVSPAGFSSGAVFEGGFEAG